MTATRGDIESWLEGRGPDDAYMIVACDTYDHSDYPVFLLKDQDFWDIIQHYDSVHEVYDLSMPIDEQLNARRAWNPPPRLEKELS